MDFEPVGASAVSGAGFGHSNHQAFAQAAGFAGSSVLLVDDAFSIVLAFCDGVQVVVRSPEERLERRERICLVLLKRSDDVLEEIVV